MQQFATITKTYKYMFVIMKRGINSIFHLGT